MIDWVDLTHPLSADTWIYRRENYSDPDFSATPWAGIEKDGYEVWKLGLGTQMGTHIDAPSHFVRGAATMDDFWPQDCIGIYRLVQAAHFGDADCGDHSHLLIDGRRSDIVAVKALEHLLRLPVKTLVLAGGLKVAHDDPLWFHRRVAEAGKFLVEDLCVPDNLAFEATGRIATVPLLLSGLSGSPTRVLVATQTK